MDVIVGKMISNFTDDMKISGIDDIVEGRIKL